jgi:hydrogenase maturation protease
MSRRVLVAGIGNVFLGDDGFGVEVVRRITSTEVLEGTEVPDSVDVADYGIRGVHLAYDLLDQQYDTLVLVDAAPLEEPPGTIAVIDASGRERAHGTRGPHMVDAHSMSPDVVLQTFHGLGGCLHRVLVVGCQPAVVDEVMGLSEPVRAAVDRAAELVVDLAREEATAETQRGEEGRTWAPPSG